MNEISLPPPPPPLPYDRADRISALQTGLIAKICANRFHNDYLRWLCCEDGFTVRLDVSELFFEYKQLFEKDAIPESVWQDQLKHAFANAGYGFAAKTTKFLFRANPTTLSLSGPGYSYGRHELCPGMCSLEDARTAARRLQQGMLQTEADKIEVMLKSSGKKEVQIKLSELKSRFSRLDKIEIARDLDSALYRLDMLLSTYTSSTGAEK